MWGLGGFGWCAELNHFKHGGPRNRGRTNVGEWQGGLQAQRGAAWRSGGSGRCAVLNLVKQGDSQVGGESG
jgi:hypothetical protein